VVKSETEILIGSFCHLMSHKAQRDASLLVVPKFMLGLTICGHAMCSWRLIHESYHLDRVMILRAILGAEWAYHVKLPCLIDDDSDDFRGSYLAMPKVG